MWGRARTKNRGEGHNTKRLCNPKRVANEAYMSHDPPRPPLSQTRRRAALERVHHWAQNPYQFVALSKPLTYHCYCLII